MTTIFRLDSSIRTEGSVSRAVADTLEASIIESEGTDTTVVRRDVGLRPGSRTTCGRRPPSPASSPRPTGRAEQAAAKALRRRARRRGRGGRRRRRRHLALQLRRLAAPQDLDRHRHHRPALRARAPRPVKGKPAFLVVARGGGYGEGTPREGWDHATAYLQRILADVWGLDLDIIETELTLAEVTPQMAGLRDLAREQLAESHENARSGGRSVHLKLRSAA